MPSDEPAGDRVRACEADLLADDRAHAGLERVPSARRPETRPSLDEILSEAGPRDVVFRGSGLYRPADLGPGRREGSRGGFHHANY